MTCNTLGFTILCKENVTIIVFVIKSSYNVSTFRIANQLQTGNWQRYSITIIILRQGFLFIARNYLRCISTLPLIIYTVNFVSNIYNFPNQTHLRHLYEGRRCVVGNPGRSSGRRGLTVDMVSAAVSGYVAGGVRGGGRSKWGFVAAGYSSVAATQPTVEADEHIRVSSVSTTCIACAEIQSCLTIQSYNTVSYNI